MLAEAALPAMVTSPKVFMEDCIMTLASENRIP